LRICTESDFKTTETTSRRQKMSPKWCVFSFCWKEWTTSYVYDADDGARWKRWDQFTSSAESILVVTGVTLTLTDSRRSIFRPPIYWPSAGFLKLRPVTSEFTRLQGGPKSEATTFDCSYRLLTWLFKPPEPDSGIFGTLQRHFIPNTWRATGPLYFGCVKVHSHRTRCVVVPRGASRNMPHHAAYVRYVFKTTDNAWHRNALQAMWMNVNDGTVR